MITSRANQYVKYLRALGSDAARRRESGEFLCEGVHLLGEALAEGAKIGTLLYSCGVEPELVGRVPEAVRFEASPDVIAACSTVSSPQGVVFSAAMPAFPPPPNGGLYLALDGVSDPGNVGTILRSADAFGIDCVFLCGESADIYSPKVVRSTMGAIFRQRTCPCPRGELADRAKALGVPLYATALSERAKSIWDMPALSGGACCIVGSEARGVSAELLAKCDGELIIPMCGRAESLNAAVAAGIICCIARHNTAI